LAVAVRGADYDEILGPQCLGFPELKAEAV
jgi:hypothetical protein